MIAPLEAVLDLPGFLILQAAALGAGMARRTDRPPLGHRDVELVRGEPFAARVDRRVGRTDQLAPLGAGLRQGVIRDIRAIDILRVGAAQAVLFLLLLQTLTHPSRSLAIASVVVTSVRNARVGSPGAFGPDSSGNRLGDLGLVAHPGLGLVLVLGGPLRLGIVRVLDGPAVFLFPDRRTGRRDLKLLGKDPLQQLASSRAPAGPRAVRPTPATPACPGRSAGTSRPRPLC